ncbi:hypothetical protein L7F22_039699 [Adiantum nelumboides]|nr:hypothetical protein [Adiantum nelumboides]
MNRTPTAAVHDMTSEEKFTWKKPDVSHFKEFQIGCIVYMHVPDELRTKLDPKAEKCSFISYSVEQKCYKCYNPVTRQVKVSRDVVFDEMATWAYEQAMEDNGIQDWEAVNGFHLIVVPKIRTQIAERQAHQGAEWQDFKKALKEEYFLEDSQRVTKQSFMKWIKQRNKGFSSRELLRKLKKRYDQLSATEQRSIRLERMELFVQSVDARLQKSLEQLLEDASREIGLTSNWKLDSKAINVIVKQQMRVDKLIMVDSTKSSGEEAKHKSATLKHKLEEPVLDDLVKGIQELNLNLKAVKLESLSFKGSTLDYKPQPPYNKIHLRRTGEPICLNFGQGDMKKLAEEILHNVTMVDVVTYDLQMEERGKVPGGELCEVGNCIRETTRWCDPVDSLSTHAYIAKSEAKEAWVEEKRKRDEEAAGTSKRATRSSNDKEEVPKPLHEVSMEDAPKDKKQGNEVYVSDDESNDAFDEAD